MRKKTTMFRSLTYPFTPPEGGVGLRAEGRRASGGGGFGC